MIKRIGCFSSCSRLARRYATGVARVPWGRSVFATGLEHAPEKPSWAIRSHAEFLAPQQHRAALLSVERLSMLMQHAPPATALPLSTTAVAMSTKPGARAPFSAAFGSAMAYEPSQPYDSLPTFAGRLLTSTLLSRETQVPVHGVWRFSMTHFVPRSITNNIFCTNGYEDPVSEPVGLKPVRTFVLALGDEPTEIDFVSHHKNETITLAPRTMAVVDHTICGSWVPRVHPRWVRSTLPPMRRYLLIYHVYATADDHDLGTV